MNRRSTLFGLIASACALVAFLPPLAHAQTAIKQSDTTHAITFVLVDSTSHIAGLTGATPVVKLSKNGASGAVPTGTVSEVDSTNCPGLYKLVPASADTGTLGVLHLSITASGADPVDKDVQVVSYDPFDATALGLSTVTTTGTTATAINTKLGTPAGASVSADVLTANTAITGINTKLGTPAGASVSADIAALPASVAAQVWGIVIDASSGSLTAKQGLLLVQAALSGKYVVGTFNTGSHTQVTTYYKADGSTVLNTATVTYASNNTTVLSRTNAWSNLP